MKKQLFLFLILASGLNILAKDSLKVLTYNIYMLPKKSMMLHNNNGRAKHLIPILDSMDFDILMLQEVFDKKVDKRLSKSLAAKYPHQLTHNSKGGLIMTHAGLRVYSKYPVQSIDQITFEKGTGIDKMATKGAMLFKVTKDIKDYYLVNTHMQSAEGEEKQKTRQIQLTKIVGMVNENVGAATPVYLLGDFNFHFKTEMMNVLENSNGRVVEAIEKSSLHTYPSSSFGNDKSIKKTLDLCLQIGGVETMYTWKPYDCFYKKGKKRKDCSDHRAAAVVIHSH